jgi:hypothetical protein
MWSQKSFLGYIHVKNTDLTDYKRYKASMLGGVSASWFLARERGELQNGV